MGGIIVLVFGVVFLSDRKPNDKVETRYNVVEYGREFSRELSDSGKRVLVALTADITGEELGIEGDEVKNNFFKLIDDFKIRINSSNFTKDSFFGSYGYIEEIRISNTDQTVAATVLIEGRDTGFAVVASRSSADRMFEVDFDLELKILPLETATVLHIRKERMPRRFLSGNSHSILVSIGGRYLMPSNRETVLDHIFGKYLTDYPFVFFVLFWLGAIAVVVMAVGLTIPLMPRFRRWAVKRSDERGLSVYLSVFRELEVLEPDKYRRVKNFADELDDRIGLKLEEVSHDTKPTHSKPEK